MSRVFLPGTKTVDREVDVTDVSSTVWRCVSKETMYIKLENIHKHRIPKRIINLYKKSVHELLKQPVYRVASGCNWIAGSSQVITVGKKEEARSKEKFWLKLTPCALLLFFRHILA